MCDIRWWVFCVEMDGGNVDILSTVASHSTQTEANFFLDAFCLATEIYNTRRTHRTPKSANDACFVGGQPAYRRHILHIPCAQVWGNIMWRSEHRSCSLSFFYSLLILYPQFALRRHGDFRSGSFLVEVM